MHTLRNYQLRAADDLIPAAIRRGRKRVCLVAPCGAGKTSIIAELCRRGASKGTTTTVTAHRRRLIKQLAERLAGFGVRYTVEMADLPDEPWAVHDAGADVVIGSRDTMIARIDTAGVRKTKAWIPDEAHCLTGAGYRHLGHAIAPEYTVGFTATPCHPDGSGFGPSLFDDLVTVTTIEDLLAADTPCLVPVKVYAPVGIGRRRRKGLEAGVAGDPVRQWVDHAAGLRTAVFCRTLAECRAVVDMYAADSVPAVHLNADTPDQERDEAIARLEAGDLKVIVCTPALLGLGTDIPALECVQTLTKNHSPVVHWQSVGRCQRPADGKDRAVLLDHAAAVFAHGMPNVSPVWSLSEHDSVQRRQAERLTTSPAAKPTVCPACGLMIAGGGRCPKCQTLTTHSPKDKVKSEREPLTNVRDVDADGPSLMQREWRKMLYSCAAQGVRCKALAARFKGRFGVWPEAANVEPRLTREHAEKPVGEVFPDYVRQRRATA